MNCPVCKTSVLSLNSLESNLSSLKCDDCGGNWIRGSEYWKWLEKHGQNLPELHGQGETLPVSETQEPKDCPECRWVMVKYRVGRELGFSLDQCSGCKGIWFDKNEWELLRSRNLHDDVHSILTAFWQTEAAKEERSKRLEQIYVNRFGAEDYAEIKRVRAWLDAHQKKHELLAYLTDENPLSL
ncbi:MAG TPA: zf-TFIIB domain-containing protein [Pyrinomonadaceae bacterium]|nr:zf-TFIIB domain-containing protein [Pyrinomonadaceae bacterium]